MLIGSGPFTGNWPQKTWIKHDMSFTGKKQPSFFTWGATNSQFSPCISVWPLDHKSLSKILVSQPILRKPMLRKYVALPFIMHRPFSEDRGGTLELSNKGTLFLTRMYTEVRTTQHPLPCLVYPVQ